MEPDLEDVRNRQKQKLQKVFDEVYVDKPKLLEEQEWDRNEWLLPAEPSADDREFVRAYDWKNKPDVWEQTDDGWRIKDEDLRNEYEARNKRVSDYDGKVNWKETRIPPRDYYYRKQDIQRHGLGTVWLRPQKTGKLHSLQGVFPCEFQHLTNKEGQKRKMGIDSRYHISLAYDNMEPELQQDLEQFYEDYFPYDKYGQREWKEHAFADNVHVTGGSTYEFQDIEKDEFARRMNEIQKRAIKKGWAHLSLD
jgi:hypothetical protein